MSTRKLLVTGASGFVGGCLLEKLMQLGCYELIALHNRALGKDTRQRFGDGVCWFKADIASDDLAEVVVGVDTVYHLAAYSSVGESDAERKQMERVNVLGTRRLADVCKKAGVRHFIFVSSIAACEAGQISEINESNGFPVSSYGKTKKDAEDLLLKMSGHGFEVSVFRATALFGENHLGSIYELVKTISQGRFVIFGRGENRTSFYYVRDFVDVLVAVQNDDRVYGQIFIAADKECSLHELVSYIAKALEYKRTIPRIPVFLGCVIAASCDILSWLSGKSLPLSMRRFRAMVRDTAYSSKKLEQMINFQPTYGVSEGIKRTVAWYRKAGLV